MLKRIKQLRISATVISVVFVLVAACSVYAATQIYNNYYGSVVINQGDSGGEGSFGAVTAVGGICDGSEPTTQMCNVNVYELESQTTLTAADGVFSDDVTVADDLIVSGETSLYGLTYGAGTLASTTTGTGAEVLTEAQMLANYLLDVQSNVDTSFVLTLPATSTMTTLLPNAGNHREWMIYNASTTAAVAMTITAGTGIDLIGVTVNDDVIDGNEYSILNCHRKADTDVVCRITEEIHVD